MFRSPNLDEDTTQRWHRDIDQVANRKFCGLEIDSHHCANFEINKQEKDVGKFGSSFTQHAEEGGKGRPDGRSAYSEESQVVKSINQQNSDRVCGCLHPAVKICRGVGQNAWWFRHLWSGS